MEELKLFKGNNITQLYEIGAQLGKGESGIVYIGK
jgi:hypothetical protein